MRLPVGLKSTDRAGVASTICLLVLALVLAACGETPDQPQDVADDGTDEPADPGTETETEGDEPEIDLGDREELVVRLATQDMQELDPAFMGVVGSWWVGHQIYSGLVRSDTGIADIDEIQPDLAESWEISDDGLEYTFHLREGVQWHKGYGEVTANDVKFSFDRIIDPELGSIYRPLFEVIREIEVVDDYTVKLHLDEPEPALLTSVLTYRPGYIVSEAAVTEKGQEDHALDPIGSGPFVFEHWQPDNEVYLSANDDYYLGPPQVSGVRMLVIQDESAVAVALETGEIHLANVVTPEALEVLDANPDIRIDSAPSIAGRFIWMNMREAPTDDVRVRQALWHATDREALAAEVFEGWHEPLHTLFPPSLWAHTDDVPMYDYDPDRAMELLEEAGYGDGFSLSLLFSQRPQDEGLCLAIQDMWRRIGVDLEIIGLDHPVYTAERTENRDDYDLILVHFGRTTDPHTFLQEAFHGDNWPPNSNASYYDGIDDLIDAGRVEPDLDRREEIYHELQQRLQEDAPGIPTVHTTVAYAVRAEVKGHVPAVHTGFAAYPLSIER